MTDESRDRIPFDPSLESTQHRFEVSADPFSQERFRFITNIGSNLHAISFYRCLTLKGSLSKGKKLTKENAAKTDINFGCFLDYEAIVGFQDELLDELCQQQGVNSKPDFSPVSTNDGKYNIFASYNLTPAMLVKIRLARRVIEGFIQKQDKSFFEKSDARPVLWPEVSIISLKGPFSIYSTLLEHEASCDKDEQTRIATTRAIALPFGMVIDGKLTPYIKAFFDTLQKLGPEIAEQKWQTVRKAIVNNERRGVIPPSIETEFPETLAEAISMYVN